MELDWWPHVAMSLLDSAVIAIAYATVEPCKDRGCVRHQYFSFPCSLDGVAQCLAAQDSLRGCCCCRSFPFFPASLGHRVAPELLLILAGLLINLAISWRRRRRRLAEKSD